MLDLAIQIVVCASFFSLPFIFMEYVRSHVRQALEAVNKET